MQPDQTDATIDAITTWLIAGAPPPKSFDDFIAEFAKRLINADLPVASIAYYSKNVHPMSPGTEVLWSEKRGVRRQTFPHEHLQGRYKDTPFAFVIESGRLHRYHMVVERDERDPDVIPIYRKAGFTDLLILPMFNVDGVVTKCIGYGTKVQDGFTEEQIRRLRRLQAPLARIAEHYSDKSDMAVSLGTYVGHDIAEKVLAGHIQRGEGEKIPAVLLFIDVAGFTALSNQLSGSEIVGRLNEFFDIVSECVKARNGEILKFMGDGALVIFPVVDDLTAQEAAAQEALAAVHSSRQQLSSISETDPLAFRASLHIGEVFYGNIGSADRLDFTAIGPAVNIASRLVDAAGDLEARTVCTQQFMDVCGIAHGTSHALAVKGFDGDVPVFVID